MDRLDLRLVEYFVAVAEELHFGRAAERLHIAQPSLSQQIRRLEAQVGAPLLARTSRRVALTPAGEAMLREGRRTLAQARRALEAARAAGRERIVVGFYGSAADVLLPRALEAFAAAEPAVSVSVRELLFGRVEEIVAGEVDVAFTRLVPGQIDAEIEVLASEPRVVALPAAHPLAGRRAIRFEELQAERFIVNPAVAGEAAPPRWLAEQRRHGLAGAVAARAASLPEILTLVAAGRGVCLVPEQAARANARPDLAFVAVTDADDAAVSLAWSAEHLRPAAERFLAVARGVARSG
jgi:DNA-binding transcriptional LysR family regulator